jgi:hypothetical protein
MRPGLACRVQRIRARLLVRRGLHIAFVTSAFLVWRVILDQQANVSGFGRSDQFLEAVLAKCQEMLRVQTISCRGVPVMIVDVLQTACPLHHLTCTTQLALAIVPDAVAMDLFLFFHLSAFKLLAYVRRVRAIQLVSLSIPDHG